MPRCRHPSAASWHPPPRHSMSGPEAREGQTQCPKGSFEGAIGPMVQCSMYAVQFCTKVRSCYTTMVFQHSGGDSLPQFAYNAVQCMLREGCTGCLLTSRGFCMLCSEWWATSRRSDRPLIELEFIRGRSRGLSKAWLPHDAIIQYGCKMVLVFRSV